MLEIYSENIDVNQNQAIPFNNVSLSKGCTAILCGTNTIQFNKCGVYMVECDCSLSSVTAGILSIQLEKDNVLQPQAQSSETGVAGAVSSLGFMTLVQVSEDNSRCCCSSPTRVQIINTGIDATIDNINVCVTKLC